jgi:hypothetical protein
MRVDSIMKYMSGVRSFVREGRKITARTNAQGLKRLAMHYEFGRRSQRKYRLHRPVSDVVCGVEGVLTH